MQKTESKAIRGGVSKTKYEKITRAVRYYFLTHYWTLPGRYSEYQRLATVYVLILKFNFLQRDCAEFFECNPSTICRELLRAEVMYEYRKFLRDMIKELYKYITYYTPYTK